MDELSWDELKAMKPASMDDDEAEFRYTIFGGNAHKFLQVETADGYLGGKDGIVRQALDRVFPSVDIAFKYKVENVLVSVVDTLHDQSQDTLSIEACNLFFHICPKSKQRVWASEFLRMLAADLMARAETNVVKEDFESCGVDLPISDAVSSSLDAKEALEGGDVDLPNSDGVASSLQTKAKLVKAPMGRVDNVKIIEHEKAYTTESTAKGTKRKRHASASPPNKARIRSK